MLGCFNPNSGQIWTNPNVGLNILNQLQLSLSTVHFFDDIFNPTFGFVHILHEFGLKQPSIFSSVVHTSLAFTIWGQGVIYSSIFLIHVSCSICSVFFHTSEENE